MKMTPFVIFDTEFTAWEGSWENNWSRSGEHRELIQIAAAIIDPNDQYKVQAEFDILIKPAVNPTLSAYIQQLTGIFQEDINSQGLDFSQAMKDFYNFCEKGVLSAYCWGADEIAFLETCKLNGINFSDYFSHFYDIRSVFKRAGIEVSKYQSGTVYQSVGLPFHKKQHYAMNDVKSMLITLQDLHLKGYLRNSFFLNCALSGAEK